MSCHILVMRVVDEDGEIQGPFVQKHWREEWRHEAASAHVYRGEAFCGADSSLLRRGKPALLQWPGKGEGGSGPWAKPE